MSKRKSTRKARPPSTALARRAKPSLATLERRLQLIQPGATLGPTLPTLTDAPVMALQFVGTLKLKADQIAALRRPLDPRTEVDWKPTVKDGPPEIPFIKHTAVRDRLDAALGLGGWGMAPVGMPKEKDGIVLMPFALVVGGVPRFYAWGEMAYIASNRQMTYGDVLEGCKSNAITRCSKELGVGRELWDRDYVRQLAKPGGKTPASRQRDGEERRQPPPAYSDGKEQMVISDKQRKRLFAIANTAGRTHDEIKAWLAVAYNISSTKDITRGNYEAICEAVESRKPLPMPPPREPGEDDE